MKGAKNTPLYRTPSCESFGIHSSLSPEPSKRTKKHWVSGWWWIYHFLVGGIPTPLKNISHLGWLFLIYGTMKVMFQSPPTSLLITMNPLFIHHYTAINHYKSLYIILGLQKMGSCVRPRCSAAMFLRLLPEALGLSPHWADVLFIARPRSALSSVFLGLECDTPKNSPISEDIRKTDLFFWLDMTTDTVIRWS